MTSARPRILWVSHFMPYPPHGGARIRSYNLLRELHADFDVDLLILDPRSTSTHAADLKASLAALGRITANVIHLPLDRSLTTAARLRYFAGSIFDQRPVTATMLYRAAHLGRIKELVAATPYDVAHVDNVELALYLSALDGLPVILNHHNVESELLRRQARYKNPALRWYFALQSGRLARLENTVCPIAAVNLTVSDLDKDAFRQRMPSLAVTTIPNGVDLSLFTFNQARHRRPATNLLWIGGMHWFPNRDAVEFFLRGIWPLIAAARPDVRLTIVGQDPPAALETAAFRARIDAPGYVSSIAPYLDRGDVYVVPIRVGGGTRLKILDAFAAGIPIVSTPVGCEGLEVADGNELLIRESESDFAAAVIKLLGDNTLRERIARRARAFVAERHSWTTIGAALRQVYQRVIAGEF